MVVTRGGDSSIARWVIGEQKTAVVLSGLTKPRVVECVGERVLVMGVTRGSWSATTPELQFSTRNHPWPAGG